MKSASVLLAASAAALTVTLSACDGLKQAMTTHVGTVAKAGSQELSVDRLVVLMNEAKMPPRKELATAIANAWLDYQLLAHSAASGDTVISPATIDSAAWIQLAGLKARRYLESVTKGVNSASEEAAARKMYESGAILAASHILIGGRDVTPDKKPAMKAQATALRAQVTSANFAEMATKNSQDVGSGRQGGKLGVFRKGQMVPVFEKALLALKPGEISPVVESQFGFHIIRRATFDEVKDDIMKTTGQRARQQAESTFVAGIEKANKVQVRSDAATTARAVINSPDDHLKDKTTLATMASGDFTAGRFARWLSAFPQQEQAQQRAGVASAPDSMIANFVKQFAINELVVKAADSAKVGATPEELQQLHQGFIMARNAAWTQLGVDPASLAAAAKTPGDREKIAAARIDTYMDKLVTGQARFAEIAPPIARVLREKTEASVNNTGIDRAVEQALKTRSATDSVRRATEPPSAVPLDAPTQGATPPGSAPQPQKR